jgi:hypothetical protein
MKTEIRRTALHPPLINTTRVIVQGKTRMDRFVIEFDNKHIHLQHLSESNFLNKDVWVVLELIKK